MINHNRLDTIEELQEAAEAVTPPPRLDVPKQWLPGWIRWPLRVVLVPFVWLDSAAQWAAKKIIRPPFKQVGHCLQRGNCCRYILLPAPKGIIARFFYFWQTQVNGFFLRQQEPIESEGNLMVVMGCRYLQEDGRCAHYRLRPSVCRTWPMIEYFGYPRILKGCGFHAALKDSHD